MNKIIKQLQKQSKLYKKECKNTMNDENIVAYQFKKGDEKQRETARKGGIASGIAKTKQRLIKDELLKAMSDDDWREMMINAIARAKDSDEAFKTLRDSIGQKPSDKLEATIDSVSIDVKLNDED